MNKNKKTLDSFVKYCSKHPEERFWQALCNWSNVSFVLTSKNGNLDDICAAMKRGHLNDTFYLEGKNK